MKLVSDNPSPLRVVVNSDDKPFKVRPARTWSEIELRVLASELMSGWLARFEAEGLPAELAVRTVADATTAYLLSAYGGYGPAAQIVQDAFARHIGRTDPPTPPKAA